MSTIMSELQISRECALLGNYDTSLLYFESVLNNLHHFIKTVEKEDLKDQWNQTRTELVKEFQLVKEIAQEIARFKVEKVF